MHRIVPAFILIALAACMSSGVRVDPSRLADLRKGETTAEQVMVLLGRPTSILSKSDGTRMLTYSYSEARADAASYIPIIGAFAGGVDGRHSMVLLRFDARDKLIDYTTTQSVIRSELGGSRVESQTQ